MKNVDSSWLFFIYRPLQCARWGRYSCWCGWNAENGVAVDANSNHRPLATVKAKAQLVKSCMPCVWTMMSEIVILCTKLCVSECECVSVSVWVFVSVCFHRVTRRWWNFCLFPIWDCQGLSLPSEYSRALHRLLLSAEVIVSERETHTQAERECVCVCKHISIYLSVNQSTYMSKGYILGPRTAKKQSLGFRPDPK